jgi:hypothetical protein
MLCDTAAARGAEALILAIRRLTDFSRAAPPESAPLTLVGLGQPGGKCHFRAVCRLDLEGIVASPQTKWWKIRNPVYSQKKGRAELFERR